MPGGFSIYASSSVSEGLKDALLEELPAKTGMRLFPNLGAADLVQPSICLGQEQEPRAYLYVAATPYDEALAEKIQNATNAICAEVDAAAAATNKKNHINRNYFGPPSRRTSLIRHNLRYLPKISNSKGRTTKIT
ncbi:MAG TPA: hypothetical protein VD770_01495 [Coxiellaceae bacterium]|nr:hypothetical protein [Coxiellaceae bacterium]